MRNLYASVLALVWSGAVFVAPAAGSESSISSPATRTATLAKVERMTEPKPVDTAVGNGKDPFYPAASDLTDEEVKAGPGVGALSDKEQLELIAAQINPTGSVELGGEPQLLFTEKRQKIGDKLTVSIDKVEYEVEIVSIEKTRFRIRYNNMETTRSIK